jgi:Spy/CpxP family protein refolding chaperone
LQFATELELTEEQISAITAINEKYRNQFEERRASFGDERPTEEQREQHRALRQTQRDEIHALLTETQLEKLEQLRTQHRAEGGHFGKDRLSVDQRIAHLTEALNLTEDQKSQMRAAFETMVAATKTEDGTRPDRESMQAARDALHSAIESILTPAQLTTFEELRQNRPRRHGDKAGDGGFRGRGARGGR